MPSTILQTPCINGDSKSLSKRSTFTTTTSLPELAGGAHHPFYTLHEILIERCRTSPDLPMVGYPASPETTEDYIYYTARQFDRFVNGAIEDLERQGLHRPVSSSKSQVVALLGPATLDYVVVIFALARMGYAVFYLSTRLSTEAYASLLEQTDCHHIVHADVPTLIKSVFDIKIHRNNLQSFIFTKSSIYSRCTISSEYVFKSTVEDGHKISYIIHSSGSTGIPKAIPSTHRSGIANYRNSRAFESYFLTLPLYHGHGVSMFFRAVFKGKPIALYNAALPLTGSHLVKSLRSTKPESLHCVPYALKLIAEAKGGIETLAETKQVLFGGSSCPDDLGDRLVEGGVRLISHYGATEFGQLMTSDRPLDDKAWNYLRPLPHAAPYLLFDPIGDSSYECVVLDGLPSKNKTNSDDPPNSFRTSDYFIKHPTHPDLWKYLGRLDDRVNLMNGEKVLPIPIEHRIRQNRFVKDVLVVGVGKLLPALIIMPSDEARGLEKPQILDRVWPDIAAANSNAEAFSHISRDMVEILPVDVWYPATEKGTLIRKACYKHFADTIEAIYASAEGSSKTKKTDSNARKLALGVSGIEDFLTSVIRDDLGLKHIGPDVDFFTAGIDSLQAIKAYGIVKRRLDLGKGTLNQNVFYDLGNIRKLALHLYHLRTEQATETNDEIRVMKELIDKYSGFQKPIIVDSEVVLLTGVTGSLGSFILSKLLDKPAVRKVYCLVRGSSVDTALNRVVSALIERKLSLSNLAKVRALPSDLSRTDLGFAPDLIHDLRSTLTKVIHSAWAVNFNIGVRSFADQHIAGVHNLINLCLSSYRQSPPEFYFCSSISSAAGTPLPAQIPEAPVSELAYAHPMGYARSKLVAEYIVQAAAEKTGMISKILRIGQIAGDTITGRWNPEEGIPLMVRSATTLGVLPALDETPSWTPVDIVAQAVLELSGFETLEKHKTVLLKHYAEDPQLIYHVVNPSIFHWTKDFLPALRDAGLKFEIVGQREWIRRLREGEQDPIKNPSVKLIEFFAGKYDNDGSRKGLVYETKLTEEVCPSLRGGVELFQSGIIKKFVHFWQQAWTMEA